MKTKLLRKLRKKAKKAIRLIQTGKHSFECRRYYDNNRFYALYWIVGTLPLGGALDRMYEYRKTYILDEIKRIRNKIYPKVINI